MLSRPRCEDSKCEPMETSYVRADNDLEKGSRLWVWGVGFKILV